MGDFFWGLGEVRKNTTRTIIGGDGSGGGGGVGSRYHVQTCVGHWEEWVLEIMEPFVTIY